MEHDRARQALHAQRELIKQQELHAREMSKALERLKTTACARGRGDAGVAVLSGALDAPL